MERSTRMACGMNASAVCPHCRGEPTPCLSFHTPAAPPAQPVARDITTPPTPRHACAASLPPVKMPLLLSSGPAHSPHQQQVGGSKSEMPCRPNLAKEVSDGWCCFVQQRHGMLPPCCGKAKAHPEDRRVPTRSHGASYVGREVACCVQVSSSSPASPSCLFRYCWLPAFATSR